MRFKLYAISLSAIFLLSACAQKVYFFEAHKLSDHPVEKVKQDSIIVESYFAGDALDYVVFELDVENKTSEVIPISYRDVSLEVYEKNNQAVILDALHKDDVIHQLEDRHEQLIREKKARDIGNAVDIGLNLLLIGSSGGYNSVGAIFYSADVATYMLEDARSHKILTGSLEEQIAYVEELVLHKYRLNPGEEGSWDILFPRQLFDADARFVLNINGMRYEQPFDLDIIEERVRQ